MMSCSKKVSGMVMMFGVIMRTAAFGLMAISVLRRKTASVFEAVRRYSVGMRRW